MTLRHCLGAATQLVLITSIAAAQLESPCVPDSPERHGELGCSVVEIKPLPTPLAKQLYWHIDRFDTGDRAREALTPTSIALEAHGAWWLMSVEPVTDDHHGGKHVTDVLLPALPLAENYSMLVISAYVAPGLTSRIHTHSGVEAFYTVDGVQCLETEARADTIKKEATLTVPAEVPMRLVALGPTPRRAFAVIVYDASKPPTTRMEVDPKLSHCT